MFRGLEGEKGLARPRRCWGGICSGHFRKEGWSRKVKDEIPSTMTGQAESAARGRGAAVGQKNMQHLLLNADFQYSTIATAA